MPPLELELDRSSFLAVLYKAQGVVDRKSTANLLSNLSLTQTSETTVRVVGTDYDVILEADLPAKILQGGAACINGKSLFDVVKALSSDSVHLRVLDNHWVEVTADRSRFKLAGIDAADFPEVRSPSDEDTAWITLGKALLKDMVEKTAFSVSNDETRMNLNGVYLKVDPSTDGMARLTMVSTDGHRLSKVELDAEVQGYDGTARQAIIHKKGVQEVRRLLDDAGDTIDVGFAPRFILFRVGGTTFTVCQIEDTYPDYERVIPPSSPIRIEVPRSRMLEAIGRIAILTSSKSNIIKAELSSGRLAFTTSNPDYGEGEDVIDVDYEGDGLVVGYNYNYLNEVLRVLDSDKVVLECSDAFSPTVLSGASEPGALFVVMPMRI